MKLFLSVVIFNLLGLLAISGCTARIKEQRLCNCYELKVKQMTEHQYQECIEGNCTK